MFLSADDVRFIGERLIAQSQADACEVEIQGRDEQICVLRMAGPPPI